MVGIIRLTDSGESCLLLPGQSCLGITQEKVKLTGKICGLLEGRSRFARLGLFVHITAGFMNPGIENAQVLEIFNSSNVRALSHLTPQRAMELFPGTKICQFIFLRMDGEAVYQGRFTTVSTKLTSRIRCNRRDCLLKMITTY